MPNSIWMQMADSQVPSLRPIQATFIILLRTTITDRYHKYLNAFTFTFIRNSMSSLNYSIITSVITIILSHTETTTFCLIFIANCQPHSTVYRRWLSLSCCRCSYTEQFAKACHFRTFNGSHLKCHIFFISFPTTWLYSAHTVTLVILKVLIVLVIYLSIIYHWLYIHTVSGKKKPIVLSE